MFLIGNKVIIVFAPNGLCYTRFLQVSLPLNYIIFTLSDIYLQNGKNIQRNKRLSGKYRLPENPETQQEN